MNFISIIQPQWHKKFWKHLQLYSDITQDSMTIGTDWCCYLYKLCWQKTWTMQYQLRHTCHCCYFWLLFLSTNKADHKTNNDRQQNGKKWPSLHITDNTCLQCVTDLSLLVPVTMLFCEQSPPPPSLSLTHTHTSKFWLFSIHSISVNRHHNQNI